MCIAPLCPIGYLASSIDCNEVIITCYSVMTPPAVSLHDVPLSGTSEGGREGDRKTEPRRRREKNVRESEREKRERKEREIREKSA